MAPAYLSAARKWDTMPHRATGHQAEPQPFDGFINATCVLQHGWQTCSLPSFVLARPGRRDCPDRALSRVQRRPSQTSRWACQGSLSTRELKSKIIVSRWAGEYVGQCGRSGWLGSPLPAKPMKAPQTWPASARPLSYGSTSARTAPGMRSSWSKASDVVAAAPLVQLLK